MLTGSPTSDFFDRLSRVYALGSLRENEGRLPSFSLAHLSPGGWWRFPEDLSDAAIAAAEPVGLGEAVARLDCDVMLPQLFCRAGMTHYRALFDVLGIPYVGNAPDVMALTADKARAKAVVAAAGIDTPEWGPSLTPPVVVKPADADNSTGVTLVREASEYDAAIASALEHSDEALVERYVELGREVRCGIVVRDGELVCLPLEEYAVDSVRGEADKLAGEGGDLRLVAKDDEHAWIVDPADPITDAVWPVARACHVALGCRDYSLFDFRVDPAGRPWFLEAGLYCSYASTSVIATMARAAGIEGPELLELGLAAALSRRPSRGA